MFAGAYTLQFLFVDEEAFKLQVAANSEAVPNTGVARSMNVSKTEMFVLVTDPGQCSRYRKCLATPILSIRC